MVNTDYNTKLKKMDRSRRIGGIAVIIVFLAIAAFLIMFFTHNVFDSAVRARVTYVDDTVAIENTNNFDWVDVWLGLDTGGNEYDQEYTYETKAIAAHETVDIELSDFKKNDGTHYDPAKENPRGLSLWVKSRNDNILLIYRWV